MSIEAARDVLEIDRWDPDLGSPPNSVVLASSENVGIDGILSCEEYPIATRATDGLQHGFVRADMVSFETPNDGAVFSVGSIAWLTSLSHNNFDHLDARFEEGMVLGVEAFVQRAGVGSAGFEQNAIVGADGLELLTTTPMLYH